jgi:hypothetical protein
MSDSPSSTAAVTPVEPSLLDRLNDFPDRLPPMLVKELRQGLRARTFIAVFLGLQLFLGLIMLIATTASGMNGAGEMVSRIIFLFFSLAVLFVQPLRAINALHGEIKSTTLDMMVLTKLNATRIVAGKWSAIIGQTLLLFVSIIPYLILRYFFGGMNLFAELIALCSIFFLSCCMTAINVGISGNASIMLRGLVPLALAIGSLIAMVGVMEDFDGFLEFFALDRQDSVIAFLSLVGAALYLSWFIFSLGVSTIAPMSENHSTFNRLLGLAVILLAVVIMVMKGAEWIFIPMIAGILAIPSTLIALTERQEMLPRVTLPFTKRGALGRLFGRFFYPCWSAGMLYTCLLLAIIYALLFYAWSLPKRPYFDLGIEEIAIFNSLIGCMLFPAVCLLLMEKHIVNRIGVYIVLLLSCFALASAISAVAYGTDNQQALWIFCWLPPIQLFMVDARNIDEKNVMLVAFAVNAILIIFLLIRAFMKWPAIREAEEDALLMERQ